MFYTKEKIHQILSCKKCKNKLDEPKVLGCGATICSNCAMKLKLDENNRYECLSCAKSHNMPEDGLPTSESLLVLLELEPNEIYRGETIEVFKQMLNQIKEKLDLIRFTLNNGYDQISEHCKQIENEIQLTIEKNVQSVTDYQRELFDKLAEYKTDCMNKFEHNRLDQTNYNEIMNELEWFYKEWTSYLNQTKINDDAVRKAHEFAQILIDKSNIELKKLNDLIFNGNVMRFVKGDSTIPIETLIGSLKLETIGSTILTDGLLKELEKLCGFKLDDSWSLIYKASKHGFSSRDFHINVSNNKNTFVVIKSSNGYIFGGYTEQDWSGNGVYKYDPNAFVFSLVNKYNKPLMLECNSPEFAIYCSEDYGPTFGRAHDLYICSDCNKVESSHVKLSQSYCLDRNEDQQVTYLTGAYNFLIDDIEVYCKKK